MVIAKRSYFGRHSNNGIDRLDEIIAIQRGILTNYIHLIASACYPFPSVLRVMSEPSFVLPAEGLPGKRYLPGSRPMDLVENEGEALVLDLFGAPSGYRATLQPHSGTQANQIVYNSVLEPKDKVLCLKPKDGGHISHTVLISRRHETIYYGLTDDGRIDYEKLGELANKNKPKIIIVGGSALPREIDFKHCGRIAQECGAFLHADISHTATFIAAGIHKPVFPHCDFATFTTVKNLRGPNSGILIYRKDHSKRVHSSIFPTTQGGANETNMLGKYATLLEWKRNNIQKYANRIVRIARILAEALGERAIKLTTEGTDCHILLVELEKFETTGATLERQFENLGVLVNKNLIPQDQRSPLHTSGIRIGVTNLAILGYSDQDAYRLGTWIADVIVDQNNNHRLIKDLIGKYHIPEMWDFTV